jgi:hypothetical protein
MVTSTILHKYAHLNVDSTILRPHAVSEIEAIKMFRMFGTTDGTSSSYTSCSSRPDLQDDLMAALEEEIEATDLRAKKRIKSEILNMLARMAQRRAGFCRKSRRGRSAK